MTNFALILNDLAASFEGRNEYISRLCRYPLLLLDDFGICLLYTSQLPFFRLSLSLWVLVLVSGVSSICWKVTATTTLAPMLMYGKEASNRKQEIDLSLIHI